MARWRFEITKEGKADCEKLDSRVRKRVLEKLEWFIVNFEHVTPIPLGEPLRGFFKLRVGDWRIIYEVESGEHLVTVHVVDHRNKIYKRLK
ncbi:type II toxin-antitoxin system mRNA interferase toxin, RelE/StbE family [bacterium]|nr:type II toxin-antitoxin system mRNA interferase toxin, RelE/StbE family [bacterium]|tara:strand:- start:336 stop:608 length:273 start_codon:yes stop_codon:yes gene_type:complete